MCSSSPSCWMAVGLVSASGQFSRFHTAALETRDVLLLGRSGGSCPVSGSFFLVLVFIDLWTNSDVYLLFWLHV